MARTSGQLRGLTCVAPEHRGSHRVRRLLQRLAGGGARPGRGLRGRHVPVLGVLPVLPVLNVLNILGVLGVLRVLGPSVPGGGCVQTEAGCRRRAPGPLMRVPLVLALLVSVANTAAPCTATRQAPAEQQTTASKKWTT